MGLKPLKSPSLEVEVRTMSVKNQKYRNSRNQNSNFVTDELTDEPKYSMNETNPKLRLTTRRKQT